MESLTDTAYDALLRARQTMKRYGIADRTLDRWLADPKLGFPRPLVIKTKRYFRVRDLMTWERGPRGRRCRVTQKAWRQHRINLAAQLHLLCLAHRQAAEVEPVLNRHQRAAITKRLPRVKRDEQQEAFA